MADFPWLTESPATELITRDGRRHRLPIFLPVYDARSSLFPPADFRELGARGFISNAFFLYRDRPTREQFFAGEATLDTFLDLPPGHGFLRMTDSGAYQQFRQKLLLKNTKIIAFQDLIGADIVSPLDLVGHPNAKRSATLEKMTVTLKRHREGLPKATRSILAGVQQGGKYRDLRKDCLEQLLAMGITYIAVGSLVPFFTRQHDIGLAFQIIRDARSFVGNALPLHIFGSGDPVEMPFFAACGGNVFDSSSFAHYALSGHYMTPYGAITKATPLEETAWRCVCPVCQGQTPSPARFAEARELARHNLALIIRTLDDTAARAADGSLREHLDHIVGVHERWFADSNLPRAWREAFPAA